jgi:pimeloyl-ACP methyl ester carboxylesterase
MAALAIEGPGQGETLSGGLKVTLTNYEAAVGAFIDRLVAHPRIDGDRVGLWGVSMGSYWGLRCAAREPRLKGVATAAGCYGDFDVIFDRAQPNFKSNFMFMAGYDDEAAFDREVVANMHLWDLAGDISCPALLGFGEFDELTRIEDTLRLFELIGGPKELLVFEQQFHPMGPVAGEMFRYASEWLARALAGEVPADLDRQRYARTDGSYTDSGRPAWWLAS